MKRIPLALVLALAAAAAAHACAPSARETGGVRVEPAQLERVVDGDTVVVRVEGVRETVRLYAVDAPETRGDSAVPLGEEATAFVEREAGDTVWLEVGDARRQDRYGRLLAYVWLEPPADGGQAEVRRAMLNARLLEAGLAKVYPASQDRTHMDLFEDLEAEARASRRGLWSR